MKHYPRNAAKMGQHTCKQIFKYLSEDSRFIMCIASQTERFLQIRLYCLFFKYVSFGEEKLNPEIVANVGL